MLKGYTKISDSSAAIKFGVQLHIFLQSTTRMWFVKKTRRGVLLGFGLLHPIPRLAKTIHISNHICVTEHHNRLSVILNLTMATLLRISSAPVRHFHQMRKMIWLSQIFSFKRLANISFCNSLDAFASITASK